MEVILYFFRDSISGIYYVMYAFVCLFLMFSIIGYLFKQKYAKVELKLNSSQPGTKEKTKKQQLDKEKSKEEENKSDIVKTANETIKPNIVQTTNEPVKLQTINPTIAVQTSNQTNSSGISSESTKESKTEIVQPVQNEIKNTTQVIKQ